METGVAALLSRCLPDDLRTTDHGRALAIWISDVGNAMIKLSREAHHGG